MMTERKNGSWPCPQCGGPTTDDDNGYHCRCGVKVTWTPWEGDEDGPPEATDDQFEGELRELEYRLADMRKALELFRALELWNDGQVYEERLGDAFSAVEKANRWLEWAKHRMARFFERGGDFYFYGPGGEALTLIDADAELKRVARGDPPPPKSWWEEL
jgi:hypothetical protein